MTSPLRPLIGIAERLPHLSLPLLSRARADPPGRVSWCQGTRASVLVFPHHRPCPECARYLARLSPVGEDLRLWATRLLVVATTDDHETGDDAARSGYPILADDDGEARDRIGVGDGDAVVIVADRYGAVYQVSAAGADHCLPDPRDLVELAKFIDIQCPECGVPGAEWSSACPLPLG